MVNTPDFSRSVSSNFREESDVVSRLIVAGKPSKKYSGNWYISGFTPSASNDWVSVSIDGLIEVYIMFDERSCITETVTRLSGFSSEDSNVKELDLSFLIVLKSVSTPTVIILLELNVVELNGVSPSKVNLSALSMSFVAIVTLCNRFGRITKGSGGMMVSPTNIIFVPIFSNKTGLRKCVFPYWDNSLTISSSVREVII